MTDALLELDSISRNYSFSQSASTNSFRALHSSVTDISSRSRKIREATRSHLRALKNVTKTEKELNAAISSYTIPEWLVRVGESCSRRPKGDVNCSTNELCKAMTRLVVSKAYLDSKPWNPVADSLGQTVDRYVKNIVAAAEDRVLLRFMNASSLASTTGNASSASPTTNPSAASFGSPGRMHHRGHSRSASAALAGTSHHGHGRTFSTASAFDETLGMSRTASTGGNAAAALNNQVAVLFGDSPPADMMEASELLTALFKNYCRIKSVLEVKSHILDKIYQILEERISEYKRLRIEKSDTSGGFGGKTSKHSSSSVFGATTSLAERLCSALKELMVNALQDSVINRRNNNNNSSENRNRNPLLNILSAQAGAAFGGTSSLANILGGAGTTMTQPQQSAATTLGITDFPECIFGVSKAARDLSLDVSSFLEKYVLTSVPPPPKRKTATERILDGSARSGGGAFSPINGDTSGVLDPNTPDQNNTESQQQQNSSSPNNNDTAAPLDPDAADEIDELRNSVLVVPSEIVEIASTFALELLAKMVTELSAKEIHSLDTAPIILLESVQEAWAWRHVAREISGKSEELLISIDQKVDAILQSAFDSLANLRDEPGNLTTQAFLDLALAPRNTAFAGLSYEILYITGVQALADVQPLNKDKKLIMNWRVDESFKRASWHPERDLYFGFSPMLVDALRRMVSVHEATLHVVFSGSVDRVDGLIKKADKAIALKHSSLMKEAKYKQQRMMARSNRGLDDTIEGNNSNNNTLTETNGGQIDFTSLNFSNMIEAESAAKGVFEYVRADIGTFFEDTITHHLVWMSSVASAAFLLAHGTFEPDQSSGNMTSYCYNLGEDEEDNLLWTEIPAGKLRFHPCIFRANTIQKIIRRLSAPGVFDVSPSSQLVWSHASMMANNQHQQHQRQANTNMFARNHNRGGGGPISGRSTSAPPPSTSFVSPRAVAAFGQEAPLSLKKPDLSLFGSPEANTSRNGGSSANATMTSQFNPIGTARAFDTGLFTPANNENNNNKPSAQATFSSNNDNNFSSSISTTSRNQLQLTGTTNNQQQEQNSSSSSSWRSELLGKLLAICNEKLEQQVEIASARWATILPNISQNDVLMAIADSPQNEPLSHDQRAEVKHWYEAATEAIVDELELYETGVIVIEDAGLRTTLGEAAYDNTSKVFEEMAQGVLKGREWSTREYRWLKFPLENLERALKTFRAPLLQNE